MRQAVGERIQRNDDPHIEMKACLPADSLDIACFNRSQQLADERFRGQVHLSIQPPLAVPTVEKVKQGPSGRAVHQKRQRSPTLRHDPAAWTSTPAIKSRPATKITRLTPGTMYAFQVRALGHEGYTDWSRRSERK